MRIMRRSSSSMGVNLYFIIFIAVAFLYFLIVLYTTQSLNTVDTRKELHELELEIELSRLRRKVELSRSYHTSTVSVSSLPLASRLRSSRERRRNDAADYIFVRGYAKSGTSWLRMLLHLHREIYMLPRELQLHPVSTGVDEVISEPWQAAEEPYRSIVLDWYEELVHKIMQHAKEAHSEYRYIGEKSPKPVHPLVDGARNIYIIRDGRDVLVSLIFHQLRIGGFVDWCPGREYLVPQEHFIQYKLNSSYFERNPDALLSDEHCVRHLSRHWAKRVRDDLHVLATELDGKQRVRIVRYEKLLEDTETRRRELYRWLGLDTENCKALNEYTYPLSKFEQNELGLKRPKNLFFRKGASGDWRNYFHDDAKR